MANDPHTAIELQPLVEKLSRDEQVRLAKLALALASRKSDAGPYLAAPPTDDEFGSDDDSLNWDADGWDEFSAAG